MSQESHSAFNMFLEVQKVPKSAHYVYEYYKLPDSNTYCNNYYKEKPSTVLLRLLSSFEYIKACVEMAY